MQNIINKFNSFFGETAKAEIKNNSLEISIGSRTLVIRLPYVAGGKGKPID